VKAVVLVGGEGTRLRPLTWTRPKQMLPVVEVLMIERVLAHLHQHGIDEVVLSLGYRPDAFVEAYPDGTCAGVQLQYATEPTPLDTAGGIRFAARQAGIDETFVVVNGDVLSDVDLGELIAFHRERGAEGTISLTPVDDPSAFGVVPTDADGRVRAFIEKPEREEAPTNLINAGFYVLEPSVLDRIDSEADTPMSKVNIERVTFPAMVEHRSLFALPTDAYWHDTGTPERYLQAHWDLLSGRRPGPPAPGASQLDPGVWVLNQPSVAGRVSATSFVGAAASIEPGAAVDASVIGAGARIGPDAVIHNSVVLAGSVIGPGAVIDGSIVAHDVVVGAGARVTGLSVLGDEVTVEPGDVLDGVRTPELAPTGR
jgi:mannose-1-phosphate guanylyltransferase